MTPSQASLPPPRMPDPDGDRTRGEEDWSIHPEGMEDGYFEDDESEPDNGGYPEEEGW